MEIRILVALAIIAVCAAGGAIALVKYMSRRRREKLRRRGIKDHRTERLGAGGWRTVKMERDAL